VTVTAGPAAADVPTRPGPPRPTRRLRGLPRRAPSWPALIIALISYVPLLLTAPGWVGADTKQYLYISPDRLLSRAPYLWDMHTGLGGVTHQNIGYLLPQGPWYWVFEHLRVPDWVAQRLWTGTLLFAAGMGVLALLRTFGWRNRPSFLAAVAYQLSPYVLEYVARISAILLPWAGLPWMVVFVVRGLRFQALHVTHEPEGEFVDADSAGSIEVPECDEFDEEFEREEGHFSRFLHGLARWRYPALFALVVALIGGTNATSLIYAGLAPTIWLPFAIVRREVTFRDALAFVARTLLLTAAVSAWWVSGLASQAAYGLDVLAYSETVKTVASDSQASEVLRGLGNWFFYGRDGISAWIQPSLTYTENLAVLAVSFAVPILSLAAAACLRWVHRAYFVTLVLVGTALSVGVYPYNSPSPAGALFKAFATGSTAGLALRSTPRAVPLVALGFGVLLAAGVESLFHLPWRRLVPSGQAGQAVRRRLAPSRWVPVGAFVAVLILIAIDMLPLWRGQFVDPNLRRPEKLPAYLTQAAASLNAAPRIDGSQTRVLELPGADFSDYRWGATLDPPLPGLMNRPYVSRELIPAGTPQSAALVRAIDRRLQEGVYEPSSLPSLARLMGVGDVVLRSDLQYERFRTPQPISTWVQWTQQRPPGLSAPKTFGPPVAETPAIPFVDEISLANPPGAAEPPAMADFSVTDPVPIVRAERASEPLLVAGDSEGLVDASAAGMLDSTGTVRFAASQTTAKTKAAPVPANADLLLTDSNRKRAERWGTVRENYGYVETATGEPLAKDPNDARLPVFPGETTADQTIAVLGGVADIEASNYGNEVSYAPADRPFYAFDGDPTTAWSVGAFGDPRGQRLRVDLLKAVTSDHLTLVQPHTVPATRTITKAELTFSGGRGPATTVDVDMTPASLTNAGQVASFPSRSFTRVEFKVIQTSNGTLNSYDGQSGVGLAQLDIPGVTATETLRLPTDLFQAAGTNGTTQPLTIMLTRDRANPQEPFKTDTELSMSREFTLPTTRTFGVGGTARVSATTRDSVLDQLLGRTANAATDSSVAPGSGVVTATSSSALPGSLDARAPSAIDDNPKTAWTNSFGGNIGAWVQIHSATPTTLSKLNLQIIADGKHSVPTTIELEVDGGKQKRLLHLPAIADQKAADSTVSAPVSFAPVTGTTFRFVIVGERRETTTDYFTHEPLEVPVAIAELGAPGLKVAAANASLPSTCRTDLLKIDGQPVGVQIGGATTAAIARDGLQVQLCSKPVTLSAGTHTLTTVRGSGTGIDLDRLILSSSAGGSAADPTDPFPGTVRTATTSGSDVPAVTVSGEGPVAYRLSVSGAVPGKPFWLVLGQSLSPGWAAKAAGLGNLGKPQLVDGYANGWLITPKSSTFEVSLDWTPQNRVWIGIGISAVALLICLLMVLRREPVRLRIAPEADPGPGSEGAPVLVSPLAKDAGKIPLVRGAIAVVISAGLAFALITPVAGLVVLALTVAALLVPRGRLLLRIGCVAALAISAGYVLEVQARYNLPETGQWVQAFHRVATISWLAAGLIVADVLVGWARRDVPRQPAALAAPEPPPNTSPPGEPPVADARAPVSSPA
jgi:arabinofuranan 3-O-arabinosyltransferase